MLEVVAAEVLEVLEFLVVQVVLEVVVMVAIIQEFLRTEFREQYILEVVEVVQAMMVHLQVQEVMVALV